MKANPIPTKYNRVMPYIAVKNAKSFLEFSKKVFSATDLTRHGPPGGPISHGELKIGDSTIMYCDHDESDDVCLMIYVHDCDATYRSALSAGAVSRGEPTNQFYGDRIAKIKDPSGISWAIASRLEDLSDEEIGQRARSNH